ncbi:MAG: peptidase M20 [Sneathiella sp.]|uniref:M20 aminoacylase family protein n=1 Tax=Sneathiella sp. TaxID=1964365 RepID=UPI000C3D20AF|nr:M20 aminoacylase family protein [Sneathiella sp.]MAZ02674.1 peptidase M20 [Sneathiella sp.]
MPVYNRIAETHNDMQAWRHDLHRHPELCYEERRTAAVVAEKLRNWGIEVHEGIGVTGVVGVLKGRGSSTKTIGIRADMDALPLQEMNDFAHKSTIDGKMHACGHDGHTAILLGAAQYLSETRNFDGTVHFIFQPAEEGGGGGDAMVKDGLFDRFPCDGVYGLHNQPGMPRGTFNVRTGPIMASADTAVMKIRGKGGHAAYPHLTNDPIAAGVQLYTALQTIVARNIGPVDNAVVSVTMFEAGSGINIIPQEAQLSASIRAMTAETRDYIESRIREICTGIAATHGVEIDVDYQRRYPSVVNHEKETAIVARAASDIVGPENMDMETPIRMGSEDFAFMLEACPGCYFFLGTKDETHFQAVHHPEFDFNDEVLSIGASIWARLVEQQLPRS